MFNWKQKWLVPALALAMAVPAAAYATAPASAAPTDRIAEVSATVMPEHGKHHKHRHWHLFMGPHREMYFTLLAEKYTPEDLDEWKAALDERERLLKEWKERRQQWKENAGAKGDRQEEKRKERIEQHRQLHEEFNKAIESQDADAIKAVLPKILAEVKLVNERLAEKLQKTDAGSSTSSVQ